MICPFCSQWNPEKAARCCFCRNRLDATEDATRADPPPAAAHGVGRPSGRKIWPVSEGDEQLARHGRQLERAKLIWSIIIAAGVSIWLLLKFKFGC